MGKNLSIPASPKVDMKQAEAFISKAAPTVNTPKQPPKHPAQQQVKTVEETKRLTIEVPASFHRAVKMSCVARGIDIKEDVFSILYAHYVEAGVYTPPEED